MDYQNPRTGLTREQKTGFVLLLIFGFLAVGLGVLQMRNTIFGPFVVRIDKTAVAEENLFLNEEARLQSIDTDHDGLNDYEELNFYETSPYLPDTDSDGLNDKEEIEIGSDPFCPKGELCAGEEVLNMATSSLSSIPVSTDNINPIDVMANTAVSEVDVKASSEADELQKLLSDPAQIRTMLLQNGSMTQAQLDKVDDVTLMKLVNEILQEQANSATTTNQ